MGEEGRVFQAGQGVPLRSHKGGSGRIEFKRSCRGGGGGGLWRWVAQKRRDPKP